MQPYSEAVLMTKVRCSHLMVRASKTPHLTPCFTSSPELNLIMQCSQRTASFLSVWILHNSPSPPCLHRLWKLPNIEQHNNPDNLGLLILHLFINLIRIFIYEANGKTKFYRKKNTDCSNAEVENSTKLFFLGPNEFSTSISPPCQSL